MALTDFLQVRRLIQVKFHDSANAPDPALCKIKLPTTPTLKL